MYCIYVHKSIEWFISRWCTVKPVFKATWEIGITWELRTATPVPRPFQYMEVDLRNKATSEFRTLFHSPLGIPNSQVSLYSPQWSAVRIPMCQLEVGSRRRITIMLLSAVTVVANPGLSPVLVTNGRRTSASFHTVCHCPDNWGVGFGKCGWVVYRQLHR